MVDLALGLKAAIMLLNPRRIVIGGGISKAGDRLFAPLTAGTAAADHQLVRGADRCRAGGAGDDSVLYGAPIDGTVAAGLTPASEA